MAITRSNMSKQISRGPMKKKMLSNGGKTGKNTLTRSGEKFAGYNKPKRTPSHPTKSHAVLAKEGDKVKLVRFGQQGVKGAGSDPKTARDKARKKSYYARHNAQGKPKSKLSAKYWSHKVKW